MRDLRKLPAILAVAAGALVAGGALAQQKPAEFRYTTGAPPNTPWVV
jgi:hypothetical protein